MPLLPSQEYALHYANEIFLDLRGHKFERVLFSKCKFKRVAGCKFVNCTFHECEVDSTDLRDVLGVIANLDCFFFGGLKFSPFILDALIHLLTLSQGNDKTRAKLTAAIDPERLKFLQRFFQVAERR